MTESRPVQDSGAPLRIFLIFMMCWILGRIMWGLLTPLPLSDVPQFETTQDVIRVVPNSDLRTEEPAAGLAPASSSDPWDMRGTAIRSRSIVRQPVDRLVADQRKQTDSENFRNSPAVVLEPVPNLISRAKWLPENSDAVGRLDQAPPSLASESDPAMQQISRPRRWTAYGWLLLRQGSGAAIPSFSVRPDGAPGAQYGASQAGMMIAYRFTGENRYQLAALARVSAALETGGEEELAIGGRIRPISSIPFAIYAEQRVNLNSADVSRTALYVAGGTGPHRLPALLTLNSWAQGGYVFGANESWFYDGSVSVHRDLARPGPGTLAVGANLWAGGQRGANRLDAGPRASFIMPLGSGQARFDLDWRQRIAGDAQPGSGLTLTLSTGF